jgi:hypothetical protein
MRLEALGVALSRKTGATLDGALRELLRSERVRDACERWRGKSSPATVPEAANRLAEKLA